MISDDSGCPCGSALKYQRCCGRWHAGQPAPTAEALMRSRYSAFVRKRADYLLSTWHASTRPLQQEFEPGTKWLGLSIKSATENGNTAEVEFVARYKVSNRSAVRLHERSRFVREDGRWFYVDGDRPLKP